MTQSQGLFQSSQQQKRPFQTVKANITDFHSHYVKSFISIRSHQSLFSFCRQQPTSKPKCKRPEQSNSERKQKKTIKSSKDFNPITAFKQQGTLSSSLYFSVSPLSPLPVMGAARTSCNPHRVNGEQHSSGAGRWVRIDPVDCPIKECQ